jgi:hypothetical protein
VGDLRAHQTAGEGVGNDADNDEGWPKRRRAPPRGAGEGFQAWTIAACDLVYAGAVFTTAGIVLACLSMPIWYSAISAPLGPGRE